MQHGNVKQKTKQILIEQSIFYCKRFFFLFCSTIANGYRIKLCKTFLSLTNEKMHMGFWETI